MSDAMGDVVVQAPSDPDAQATVTDFLDYTEYLPADLIRSLTLIRKLDESYIQSAGRVDTLTKSYGSLPSLPVRHRPEPQQLRSQISYDLNRALGAREASYAEASRLYDVVDRHFNRLGSILSKLQSLPLPPSRDPTPAAPSKTSPQSQRRTRKEEVDVPPQPRITLRLDGARAASTRAPAANRNQRNRNRRVTVPGEVLPPHNPASPSPSTASDWDSLPSVSPVPVAASRVSAPPKPPKPQMPKIKPPKPPKPVKLKIPKVPKPPRPEGSVGDNDASDLASISMSNALAMLSKPPEDAVAGSVHAPWLRLTPYEMAKLRKRMKKNAVWNPSETMIRRELADLGRGPENYHLTKNKADATGEQFIDEANIADSIANPVKRVLAEGEIGPESLGMEEIQLSNRGMKLNEAKKLKKENMQKEMAALAAAEAEQAAQRLADSGSALKHIFAQPGDEVEDGVPLTPSLSSIKLKSYDGETPKPVKKRKRNVSPSAEGKEGHTTAKVKKRKVDIPAPITTSITKVPLAAPGVSSPLSSAISSPLDKTAPPVSAVSNRSRSSLVPKVDSSDNVPSRRSSRASIPPVDTPTTVTAGKDRPRRASTASVKYTEPAAPARIPPARRGKRPAPGPVREGLEGGAAVSVGKRKAPPRKRTSGKRTKADDGPPAESKEASADEEGFPADPDEPTYCVCGDVSFGTMIACENNDCEREWFHLECVGLEEPPGKTTKWYCPDCRKELGVGKKGQMMGRARRR